MTELGSAQAKAAMWAPTLAVVKGRRLAIKTVLASAQGSGRALEVMLGLVWAATSARVKGATLGLARAAKLGWARVEAWGQVMAAT